MSSQLATFLFGLFGLGVTLWPFVWGLRCRVRARQVEPHTLNEATLRGRPVCRLPGSSHSWVEMETWHLLSELDTAAVEKAVVDRELARPLHERGQLALADPTGDLALPEEAP